MKKTITVLVGGLILGLVGIASATPYKDVVDFSSSGVYLGQSYSLISDSNSINYFGLYNHSVDFNPDALSVTSATLRIDYAFINKSTGSSTNGNLSPKEIYFISESGDTEIGQLTWYDDNLWHYDQFNLSSYILGVSGSNWSIGFKFNETTNGTDTFYLDKSTLSGDYTPNEIGIVVESVPLTVVPEPSTFLLLGAGLLGLAALAISRRRKE